MIQCSECEHFHPGPDGQVGFSCDPLRNIKEPECLAKWQILRLTEVSTKLDRIVSAYEATSEMYKRLAPLQEKMFRHMEREIDEVEEADAWKQNLDDDEESDSSGGARSGLGDDEDDLDDDDDRRRL